MTLAQKTNGDQLTAWISEHPDVIFIEENNLNSFSQEELAKFSGNYIVFSEELTVLDVMKYDPSFQEKTLSTPDVEISHEKKQADATKEWISNNPHVKVITRAEFLAQPLEVQQEYTANKCLILSGETITHEDIKNYQH